MFEMHLTFMNFEKPMTQNMVEHESSRKVYKCDETTVNRQRIDHKYV